MSNTSSPSSPSRLLFATGNPAKRKQLQFVADMCAYSVRVASAYDAFPGLERYPEDETAPPAVIACDGARHVFRHIRQPVVAEDTVIRIPSLRNRGIIGRHASGAYLVKRGFEGVLQDMEDAECRSAAIESAVAYCDRHGLRVWQTTVTGRIADAKRYRHGEPVWVGPTHDPYGGGYNAIFEVGTTGRTLAEHTAREGLQVGYREPSFWGMLRYWSK